MKGLLRNPHLFFFIVAVIIVFMGLLTPRTETFDLNILDTYYVMAKSQCYFLFSFILIVIGIFYKLVIYKRVSLSTGLIKIHWLFTILTPLCVWVLPLLYKEEIGPQGYLRENGEFNFYLDMAQVFFIPLSLFLVICLLPFNLIWSLRKARGMEKD